MALTLAEFRKMTVDLPDDAFILVDVRCSRNVDEFHDPIELDSINVDLTWQPEVHLQESCCGDTHDE